jgi:copper(I)-binding protein
VNKNWMYFLAILVFVAALSACAANAPASAAITIEDPWARAAAALGMNGSEIGSGEGSDMGGMQGGGGTGAVYMVIRNAGQQADRLLKVHTTVAETAETHISEMRDGVMTMSRVDGIDIPARSAAELKPGGLHIMLINLKQDLVEGETIPLTLVFEQSGTMELSVPVRNP